jgi:transitional endoplasmic reticulum ATPase
MSIELSAGYELVRVRSLSGDRRTMYLELRNGLIATANADEPFGFSLGDVLLYNAQDRNAYKAPAELWPSHSLVGVVRLKLTEKTVVDASGRFILVPTNDQVVYSEGSTVQFEEYFGVTQVLADHPISFLDSLSLDDSTVARFKTEVHDQSSETFDDFGGLPEVINRAKELIETPLKHREALTEIGARPIKGVLLLAYQEPVRRCLLASSLGVRRQLSTRSVGRKFFNKWLGQSEELVRRIFEDAAKQERAIIFFDEIDSIAAHRETESHEASRRVVAQLLTAMDGFTKDQNVIVIATTNRPQDIDVALRRPGRLDWEIHFPLPD